MSRQRPAVRIRALVLTGVCAATLGLAACGEEEESTAPTTEAEAATSTEEEATEEETEPAAP